MRALTVLIAFSTAVSVGCKGESEEESDECYTNNDCPAGQVCVISHDHEGDDHDHGGDCETPE